MKKTILSLTAVLGTAVLLSCTGTNYKSSFPPVCDTVFYKVQLFEKSPMTYVVSNLENAYIDASYHNPGDTLMINEQTKKICQMGENGTYAKIVEIMGHVPNEIQPERD